MLNFNYTKIKKVAVFAAGIVGAYCAGSLFFSERRKKNELPEKVDEPLETEEELLEEEAKEEVEVS